MQIKHGYILLIAILFSFNSYGQSGFKPALPSVGLGCGALSFYGDVGNNKLNPLTNFRVGYHVDVKERFSNSFSVSLSLLSGKVAASNGASGNNLNFESSILNGGLSFFYHFDNDYILKRSSLLSPYIGVGVGFMSFKPMGDLKDKNGNTYNYWSDGSIRNVGENEATAYTAVIIKKDYVSETNLHDLKLDGINYSLSTITFPVTGGVTFNLSSTVGINMGASYYFTRTDWLDNISSEGKGQRRGNKPKDHFLYSFVGLNYNFGKKAISERQKNKFSDVDFAALEKADSDHDGVPDTKDKCPGTAANLKVDQNGCPYDDDGDGVPNELDKEPKTLKGTPVDANGVKLSKKTMDAKIHVAGDRIAPSVINPNNPTGASLPEEFRWVDQDADGKISQKEINSAIDRFFDGDPSSSLGSIMKAIDYFFDQ